MANIFLENFSGLIITLCKLKWNGMLCGYNVGMMGHSFCPQDLADISLFALVLNVDVKLKANRIPFHFCR